MFCPVCKAEYREGFTECSDCGVGLVEQLSDDSGSSQRMGGDPDAMEILWAGVDAKTSASIGTALDAAKVAYREDSVESQLMPAFRQSISRIRVRRGDFEAAIRSIQDLAERDVINLNSLGGLLNRYSSWLDPFGTKRDRFDGIPIGASSAAEPRTDEPKAFTISGDNVEEDDSAGDTSQNDLVEDFYPEDATAEVWSGDDAEMAENIRMCLREVGIGCDVRLENSKSGVYVLPQSDARAREIIREIVEATPPE